MMLNKGQSYLEHEVVCTISGSIGVEVLKEEERPAELVEVWYQAKSLHFVSDQQTSAE
jgi:hypothetical protein